jgi:hypothetical protein
MAVVRAVPRPDPHDARDALAEHQPQSAEVGVLGDHDVIMLARERRDGVVVSSSQTKVVNMGRIGKDVGQSSTKEGLRFFVESGNAILARL